MLDDLIDRIYEAAFVPEMWPGVLTTLTATVGATAGVMMLYDGSRPVGLSAIGPIVNVAASFISSGAWKENRRIDYFHNRPFTGFVIAREYFGEDYLKEEIGFEGRQTAGLDDQIGSMVPMPGGELAVFAFDRLAADGRYGSSHIDLLNETHPHLARSALIAARLGMEKARAMTAVLQEIGLPAAVMTGSGRVLAANALLEAMGSTFLPVAFGSMAIADEAANRMFQETVQSAKANYEPLVRSIPVVASQDRPPLIVHVLPLRRAANDIFSGGDMLVVATEISPSSLVPSPNVLSGLFDLTPAEARLASALSQGRTLKDAAMRSNITVKTSRTYLERIFAKTGTHQQSQLVALLKSTGSFASLR